MTDEILNTLKNISASAERSFNLVKINNLYWGKDDNSYISFGVKATSRTDKKRNPQKTDYLTLFYNAKVKVSENGESTTMNIITLTNKSSKFIKIFIDMSKIFENVNDEDFVKKFNTLNKLFKQRVLERTKKIKGIYGELAVILYTYDILKINLTNYYQKEEKELFDFSILNTKRIDVKTTTNPVRDHTFKYEQMNNEKFDIVIASVKLEKNYPSETSVLDLIEKCSEIEDADIDFLEMMKFYKNNLTSEDLNSRKYYYDNESIKFYLSSNLPRIKCESDDSVHDIKFNIDLSNKDSMSVDEIKNWINSQ